MAERRGQSTFADAGRTGECQIVMRIDPLTLDKLLEQRPIETARAAIIDVLDTSLLTQFRVAQSRREPFVLTPCFLAIEQESQPFAFVQGLRFIDGVDFDKGFGHPVKAEGVELVECWMIEQDRLS
jgi:hypothetical protein